MNNDSFEIPQSIQLKQPIGADDVTVAEVEWTREPAGYVTDIAQLGGRAHAPHPCVIPQEGLQSADLSDNRPVTGTSSRPVRLMASGADLLG